MKFLYTFILLLCSLATKAEVGASDSVACVPVSILLSNDKLDKQKAQGKEYKQTAYWKKHKRYKVGAYCVLGVGSLPALIGMSILCSEVTPDWEGIKGSLGVTFTVGGVLIGAASIPLFVAAHKYKKKAKNTVSLTLNCSKASTPLTNGTRHTDLLLGACLNF